MTLHRLLRWTATALLLTGLVVFVRQAFAPWTTQELLQREVPAVEAAIRRELRPLADQEARQEAEAAGARPPASRGAAPAPAEVFTSQFAERAWDRTRAGMLQAGAAPGYVQDCLNTVRGGIAAASFWSEAYMVPVYVRRARVRATPVWLLGFGWALRSGRPGDWLELPLHFRVMVVEARPPYKLLDSTNCM